MKVVDKAKKVALKAINFVKKILNTIKFFATPLGTVVGWIIFIIFAVLLLIVIVEVAVTALKDWIGISTDYDTYVQDLAVINDLYSSGYSSQIDPENFVNFKAFEYAVLLDAAEYIRNQGQTKFDILENQLLYQKEKKIYEESIYSGEYKAARANSTDPAVSLLKVDYNTNQGIITKDELQEILKTAATTDTPRHVDPVAKYPRLEQSGEVVGGNNRVSEPYLVYEFVRSAQTADESGELTASAIPYVYIIREDIKYTFYFNEDQEAIEVPFLLNAYIRDAGTDSERVKEAMRITAGLPVKVWPDKNMDHDNGDYTWTPYYDDDSKSTIYKIPLQTLIGRYMPRTELLHAWTMLKQNIDQNIGKGDEELEAINGITDKIKQIYSEACLDKETKKTHEETVTEEELDISDNSVKEVEKTYKYDQDTTNKTSFVEFQKVGLETTMYKEYKSDVHNITYVSGFGTATILVDNQVTIHHSDLDGGSLTVKFDDRESVGSFGKEKYIIADDTYGNAVDGYAPPNNLNTMEIGLLYGGENLDQEALKTEFLDEARKINPDIPGDASVDIKLETYLVFHITTKRAVGTMEVEHRRMPALLVSAATTWARTIRYAHKITQNMFEPTNPGYIIPNCTKSLGIASFVTTEPNKGETYRGKAYEEIFFYLQEKDVLSMLITLESAADQGINDCYEYMRELYKLVKASQDYSQKSDKKADEKINPNTYTYVYLPDSILYYNDTLTQAIYWQELLGQRESMDSITKEEVARVRTRDPVLKWQIVDYDNYPECEGKVYALNPFGSAYVRAAQQLAWELHSGEDEVNGAWNGDNHKGADLYGRNWITSILGKKGIFKGTYRTLTDSVYSYSLKQLKSIYNSSNAEEYLEKQLEEELLDVPIVAVAPGKVIMAGYGGMQGFSVTIQHSTEVSTLYCHLKRWPTVAVGDYVGAGTLLGYEGNTGRSHGVHLHFQINVTDNRDGVEGGTVNPTDYIYPTFNPFYYGDKAAEDGYDLSSEYMTLYRTVYMLGESEDLLAEGSKIKNTVPAKALLESTDLLIQKQGTKKTEGVKMEGDLGWAETKYNDLYIDKKFFNPDEAKFEMDSELLVKLYGYLPVKTDMIGGLPALTRKELDYILKYWLSNRYPNKNEYNWLMDNVFTEDTIQKILEGQDTYKVSAVFALAVGAKEQQLGLECTRHPEHILGKPGIYNIFSIKGSQNGGIEYNNSTWNIYDSYGDAFMKFYEHIAGENNIYFNDEKYLIATIGPTYCPEGDPPGGSWIVGTTTIAYDIMKYYTGTDWSTGVVYADNSKFLNIARNFITILSKLNYGYGEGETEFDPFNNIVTTNNGLIDCSGYVAATVRAYGKFHDIDALIKCNYNSPDEFAVLASDITRGKATDVGNYFEVVWKRNTSMDTPLPEGSSEILKLDDLKGKLEPGDILIFGYSNDKGGKHVEIFAGDWNNENQFSVYNCGHVVAGEYDDGDPTWSDHLKSEAPAACSRRTLYGILRLKSNN